MEKSKFCPAMWFSGFFGLGALVHLVRAILGFSLVIGGVEISVGTSMVLAVILASVSAGLLAVSLKRPCEEMPSSGNKGKGNRCGL